MKRKAAIMRSCSWTWTAVALALVALTAVPRARTPPRATAQAAQAPAAPASASTASLSADEIIAKHIAARGGLEKIAAIQSLMMTGRLRLGPDMESPITVRVRRPNQIRHDFILQTRTGTRAYDGAAGWQRMPTSPTTEAIVEPLRGAELKDIQDEAENGIDGALVNYREKGHTVALAGRETFDGKACYVLKVTLRTGHVMRQYVAVDTFLVVGDRLMRSVNGKDVEIAETVGDYRDVGGVLFPHLFVSGTAEQPAEMRLQIEKIVLNPTLDDVIFKAPDIAPRKPPQAAAPVAVPPKPRPQPQPKKPAGRSPGK